ncbi:hypothetical protein VB776_16330 [Arcicella sp. DC2W]|uniref:Uncharacterized protein n=1 Tax=Arcicella gelida TaxID=2984195 RepID=A0ABU5S819_9BACT|nr:hypothetical protein [Arcicella sp. DC2W]MEA5404501.1 hypothetical protein [Arcicella sp. DC2W]
MPANSTGTTGNYLADIGLGLLNNIGMVWSSGNQASAAQANAQAQLAAAQAQQNANLTDLEKAKIQAQADEAQRLADQKSQQTLLIAGFGGLTFIGILLYLFKKK